MMFPRVVGLLFESRVSVEKFMKAFEEGYEFAKVAGDKRGAISLLRSSSFSPAAAAAPAASSHGVFGCPSRNCAVDGADCVMVQVRVKQ
jgi:hypothetical protein